MPVTAENKEYSQLAQLVPLNTLTEDALKSLLQNVDIVTIKKDDLLFKEGDVDNLNIYLLSGRIGLLNGDKQVDLVEDSSATARFPVAHQLPRKFSAKALSKLEVVRIDSRMLSEALAKNESGGYQVEDEVEQDEDADWMTQLLQSRVMQNIPAANLQGVMMRMQEIEVKEGDLIIKEGDEGDFYYLLHRGHAVVLGSNEEKTEEIELNRLGPGAAFGEDALLSNRPRTSSVKMLTDGVLLRLAKDDFIELIKHPLSDTVSYEAACKKIEEGGLWLDVRDAESYEQAHLPGAINLPYSTLRYQLPSLSDEIHYVVYSQTGTRSIASAFLFMENGLEASILDGGFENVPQEGDEATDSGATEEAAEHVVDSVSSDEVNQLRKELEELRQQLVAKDEQLKEGGAGSSGGSDNEEIARLKKENEKLEREIIGLTGQLESEEDGYDKLKQQYDGLSSENKKHLQMRDKDIATLKEELTVLQLEKDQLESDYEELLESQGDGGSTDNADLESRLQQASNQVSQLEALNASITEDRDKQRFDLEEARNQLSLINQENSELQLEIADLKGRLDEISAQQPQSD